ncbi:MAG: hypothetical protein ACUVSC_12990, partial [Candidatus Fervidibacter sp.]
MKEKTSSSNPLENLKQQIEKAERLKNLPIEDLVLPKGSLDKLAKQFSRTLKSTQLRQVFNDIKRLEQDARRKRNGFQHIRTQLALIL